jgi:anti-sigma B factor antagonist
MKQSQQVEASAAESETLAAVVSVEIVWRDGIALVTPDGELDVYAAPMLRGALRHELDSARSCVVDLRKVSFIDCSIVSVLLAAEHDSASRGVGFAVVVGESNRAVQRLLRVVGVALPVHDGVDGAIQIIGRRARRRVSPSAPHAAASGAHIKTRR